MSLPKIDNIFTVVHLPIEGIDVKVYGFTVREEKTLIAANMSGDIDAEAAVIDLIKSKVPSVDVENLTVTDIIFLFITILGISKGTSQDFIYKCNNLINDKLCGNKIKVPVSLSNFVITGKSNNHKLIHVNDSISIELVYPSYKVYSYLKQFEKSTSEYIFRLYSKCIYAVYTGDDATTEFTNDEIYNWIMTLPSTVIKDFESFISAMPTLSVKYDVVCDKCGYKETVEIKNILSFFTQPSQEKI